MTDVLSPEQVAGIRDRSLHGHLGVSPTSIVALCDTVDDLRKRLNNLRHEQNRWVESDQAAMRREKKALQDVADLSERLRKVREFTYCAYCNERFRVDGADATGAVERHIFSCEKHPIRHLAAALRGLLDSGVGFDDERIKYITVQIHREDWRVARELLAEMGGKRCHTGH
ncbi:hypothetical protein LCGC14_2058010 [marine sediment metagenome]|uniref:Uncharacterized protein n=1 Tax=marine sediment metagenome TaxID=412755 RepID=A0A0F9ELW3_9ZZZZ